MEVYYNRNNKILHLKNCENLKYKEDFDLINLFDEELNTVKFCKGCNCSFKYKFFKEVQFYCKQLKLKMDFKFNLFFIKSKFNNWRFELPNDENQKIILYHINLLYSNNNDDFHIQFRRNISAEKIVKYIYCHDYFKYTCFNTNNKEENMLKKIDNNIYTYSENNEFNLYYNDEDKNYVIFDKVIENEDFKYDVINNKSIEEVIDNFVKDNT